MTNKIEFFSNLPVRWCPRPGEKNANLWFDHDLDRILTPELNMESLGSPVQGKPVGDERPGIGLAAPDELDGGREISPQAANQS
jgi:hypothetical protein